MLKQIKLLSILTLSAVAVACSGGGGGAGTAETPDGTKVDLTNTPKGLVRAETMDGKLIGYNQNHSFYGVWVNDGKTRQEIRYQGTSTPESGLPRGSATYTGHAVRTRGDLIADTVDGVQADGKTTLNVNFDTKKVSGLIEMPWARDITLHETDLKGSQFSGKASVIFNNGGHYKGGLFGPNAEEAAGLVEFSNNPALNTSFGGYR
ncbi:MULTISPECIES: factor H binding protein domain-containing protein [unclassified Pasteurella]|uniref:factor H binding protein domain-containing protein n=1 Tax=unclassified Pasteurella TaxID=2621516 RepID=UPI001073C853|nr:transferrin-binding protein-like solute binding protein [Pasteurella sp. 19428wF3_WM03]TFU52856.1 hypothetical protein E4T92_00135 [Pasteurella sp. WM03]